MANTWKTEPQLGPGQWGRVTATRTGETHPSGPFTRIRFANDRIPPARIQYELDDGSTGFVERRTGHDTWWARVDAARIVKLSWDAPASGAVLIEVAPEHSEPDPAHDYTVIGAFKEALGSIGHRPESGARGLHRAAAMGAPAPTCLEWRALWIKLDLALSFRTDDHLDLDVIAHLLGIDVALLRAIDGPLVQSLEGTLVSRWQHRTSSHAACRAPSPDPAEQAIHEVAVKIVELMLLVMKRHWPGGDWHCGVWEAVTLFGAGLLRRPNRSRELFNAQPNGTAFLCFAELFDLILDQPLTLPGGLAADARFLRGAFVAALEPFFDTYWLRGFKRVRTEYRPDHLEEGEHEPWRGRWSRWSLDQLKELYCDLHGWGLEAGAETKQLEWLRNRWGRLLAHAFADDSLVTTALCPPCPPTATG